MSLSTGAVSSSVCLPHIGLAVLHACASALRICLAEQGTAKPRVGRRRPPPSSSSIPQPPSAVPMPLNAIFDVSGGGRCSTGRPPRVPGCFESESPSASRRSIAAHGGDHRPDGRGRRLFLSNCLDEGEVSDIPDRMHMLPRRAVGVKHSADGAAAIAEAIAQKRRRRHGGTPARSEQNGALSVRPRSRASRAEMASLKVEQAVARASLTRLVGVRAEAAAAAATLRTTTTQIDVRAAAATDDRAFAAFCAAEADAATAVATAAVVRTAATSEAVVEASLVSGSSSVYFSPVSDFE